MLFFVVVMPVGHLNPSPDIFLGMYSSLVGKEGMLLDMFLRSFSSGLSSFSPMSFSYNVRCGA